MVTTQGIRPSHLKLRIDDPIIRSSRLLVLIPQVGFPLDFWNYGSLILSTIRVVYLWWLAKEDSVLTFGITDPWSYHTSNLMTCGDSQRGLALDNWIKDRWSYHQSKSLSCGDSPRGISSCYWNCGSMILSFVPVVDLWRFTKEDLSLTFGITDRWSYHTSKSLTCGDSPREITPDFWKCRSMILSSVQVVYLWRLAKRISPWQLD